MDFEPYKTKFKKFGVKYLKHSIYYNILFFGGWLLLSIIISYELINIRSFTYNPDAYLWTMSTIFQGLSAFLGLFWAGLFFGKKNLDTNIEEMAKELERLIRHPSPSTTTHFSDNYIDEMLEKVRLHEYHITDTLQPKVETTEKALRELRYQKNYTSSFPNIPSVHAFFIILLSISLLALDPFLSEGSKIGLMLSISFLAVYVFGLIIFSVLAIYHNWGKLLANDGG